jgi:hypothetical protein
MKIGKLLLMISFLFYLMIFYFLFSFPKFSNQQLNNYEIKPGKCLKINVSVPNLRLFVGNIPKSKGKEEILDEFGKLTGKWQKIKKRIIS